MTTWTRDTITFFIDLKESVDLEKMHAHLEASKEANGGHFPLKHLVEALLGREVLASEVVDTSFDCYAEEKLDFPKLDFQEGSLFKESYSLELVTVEDTDQDNTFTDVFDALVELMAPHCASLSYECVYETCLI